MKKFTAFEEVVLIGLALIVLGVWLLGYEVAALFDMLHGRLH